MNPQIEGLARELLQRADSIQDVGIAYGVAKEYLSEDESEKTIDANVQRALLNLYDQGHIFFFRSTWDDGYSADVNQVVRLTRPEIEAELEAGGGKTDAPDQVVFFYRSETDRDRTGSS